jgi:NADH:ubiquinone oxidoreductase subunit 6 (subunit J)
MTDLWLFIIVGAIAVAAAVMMLLSENAVHSALFLVVTMVCIAFLYLMLNSPFLAMIQITVYAGAIMVLFIFVIMLLGAERLRPSDPGPERSRFRWFTPVALTLALALLFSIGLVTIQGNIDSQEVPLPGPTARVVNAANAGPVDVYVGSLLAADDLPFGDATEFVPLTPGEFNISVRPVGGGEVTTVLNAQPGTNTNLIVHDKADGSVGIALSDQNIAAVAADGAGRVQIFNAFPDAETVSVVDARSFDRNTNTYLGIIAESLPFGGSATVEPAADDLNWNFLANGDVANVVASLTDQPLRADSSDLFVVARQDLTVAATRTIPVIVPSQADPQFGSPRSIGFALFTDFLLPFQLLGLVLLASMVGVIVLSQRVLKPVRKIQARRKVSKPLAAVISSQVGQEVVEDAPLLPVPEKPSEPEPVP